MYYDWLFFAALWASSMCIVLYKVHRRFEQVWHAINQLDRNKLDIEP
jgi:hypothetical protein